MSKYQVVVGNVGLVLDTDNMQTAARTFQEYVWKSLESEGRCSGEPVTLMRNGEPVQEFDPGESITVGSS